PGAIIVFRFAMNVPGHDEAALSRFWVMSSHAQTTRTPVTKFLAECGDQPRRIEWQRSVENESTRAAPGRTSRARCAATSAGPRAADAAAKAARSRAASRRSRSAFRKRARRARRCRASDADGQTGARPGCFETSSPGFYVRLRTVSLGGLAIDVG